MKSDTNELVELACAISGVELNKASGVEPSGAGGGSALSARRKNKPRSVCDKLAHAVVSIEMKKRSSASASKI